MTLGMFNTPHRGTRPRAKPRIFGAVALLASVVVAMASTFSVCAPVQAQSAEPHPGKPSSTYPATPNTPSYQAPPSQPWYDTPIEVVQIKFDYTGPDPHDAIDGLDCCYKLGDGPNDDLHHKGEGKGDGEYDTINGYNEPAVYVQGTPSVRIRVRFKVNLDLIPNRTPYLSKAKIKAVVTAGDWLDVCETEVNFDHTTQYSVQGVSEYVPMYLGDEGVPLPSGLQWEHVTWSWSVRDQEFIGGGGESGVVQLGTTTHQFFTILDKPKTPWYQFGTKHHIPINLLMALYGSGGEVGSNAYNLRGIQTEKEVLSSMANTMHTDKYFHVVGSRRFSPLYTDNKDPFEVKEFDPEGIIANPRQGFFRWMKYFAKSEALTKQWIHHTEPAFALNIVGRLLGFSSYLMVSQSFGFQKPQQMIGGRHVGDVSNPWWRDAYHPEVAIHNLKLTDFLNRRNTLLRHCHPHRNYTWVEYDYESWDAYVGPHIAVPARLTYLNNFRWVDSLLPPGDVIPLHYLSNPPGAYSPIPEGNETLWAEALDVWDDFALVNHTYVDDLRLGYVTPRNVLRRK